MKRFWVKVPAKILSSGLLIVTALAIGSPAWALSWAEVGDAGPLPGTAQGTSGVGALTQITGAISPDSDADMYQIYITGSGTFSATTVGTPGTLNDTQLFLFNASGFGVYANDDSGGGVRSTLPASDLLTPMAPGNYFLLITGYNLDPVSAGGLIFPTSPFSGLFGPTGPGGGSPISGYSGSSSSGTYTIYLTGSEATAVPEPAILFLLGSGLVGLWVARKKFRK